MEALLTGTQVVGFEDATFSIAFEKIYSVSVLYYQMSFNFPGLKIMGETAHLQLNSNSRETNPSEFNRELTVVVVVIDYDVIDY